MARNVDHLPDLWRGRLRGIDWCGVSWYTGRPHFGKTTLGLHHANGASCALGLPTFFLDSRQARQLAHVPHMKTLQDACKALWIDRASVAWRPRSILEVDRACAAIEEGRNAMLFVDESHFWLSARSGSSSKLIGLMRANQHVRTHVFLTTQHFSGDIPQGALACAPDVYAFRTTSWRARRVLRDEFEVDPLAVARLAKYQYLEIAS